MKYEYTLDENDYLENTKFTASRSPTVKRTRLWTRSLIPVAYIVLGALTWDEYHRTSTIILFVLAVLWFFISPWWLSRRYVQYYKKAIKEAYGQRIGRTCSFELEGNVIIFTEATNEGRTNTSDIDSINELPAHIILKMKTGVNFILPKEKINHVEELKKELKELATRLTIPYNDELNWKWR